MKQENGKKSKKWLWLVIALAALLAVAGIVLALLLPGEQKEGDPDVVNAELYWNIDGKHYMETSEVAGFSARTAAEDGNYYIDFAYEGQRVTLQIVDKQLVNYIDNMQVAGLVFDANGVVVDAVPPETVATETASDFYVQKAEDGTVILNSSRALNGMNMELTLTDSTGIWDTTDKVEFPGAAGELEIMDRVLVYSDLAEENVTHIYILEHPVEAGIYWRVERLYDTEKKVTTRVPDENGVYTMEFAHEGEIVELKCRDALLVTDIDSRAILSAQFAFLFDEEGYIVEMTDIAMALRGKQMAADYHITAIDGDTYTATRISSGTEQGRTVTFTLAEGCDIFQVCQFGCYDHHCGERVDSLQMLDRVNIYGNVDDEAVLIFVTRRIAVDEFYYNYNRQYGGADKGTNRTKQSDGYYHFELLLDGKVKTVRAKKDLADQMDAITSGCMGLKLNGNVVERVYDAGCVTGGSELGAVVTMKSGPVLTLTSTYSGTSWNVMMSGDCKIYNAMTGEYGKTVGGTMELMEGDDVMTFRNHANEVCIVFVRSRAVEGAKVYYNLERKWSNEKQETTRVPNEEGYYEFLMACEGKQVTVKTKSKGMASFIDQQLAPLVGLKVNKSGVVTNAYSVDSVIPKSGKACNYRYVENVTKKSFNTYYIPSGTTTKVTDTTTWQIAKDCKIYNVSTAYSQFRGEKSTLKNGDYIQAIRNYTTNEITQIYIMQRDPTYGVKSYQADCAHCGKNVTWEPYGGKEIPVKDGHYFMCVDLASAQRSVGTNKDDQMVDIVLDLKGYTLSSTTRTFLIYDSLTIMDTKGGGKLMGTTPTSNGTATSGSCIMLGEGGKLNIMGGELTLSDKCTEYGQYGGVLYIGTNAEVTMSGGKISGGTATTMGGNVAILGGSFTMTGGVIENGTSPNGGCIRLNSGSFTMTGGTVDGNITKSATGILELSGAPVIKGAGLTVTAGTKLELSKLSKDASVAVQATGIFTDVLEDPESWLNIIKPGAEGDKITVKNGALCYIVSGPPSFVLDQDGDGMAVCPVCGGEEVAWTAVSAGERVGSAASGHYYIKENGTSAHTQFATTTAKEAVICIHMNGKTVTTSGRIATVGSGGTINIMGDGTIIGNGTANGGTDAYTDAVLVPNSGGSINLYDNVTVTTTAAGKPVVKVYNNANIRLYGNAKIQNMEGGEGILIEKGKLTVAEGWTGSALVKFPTALTDGVVSKSNGASTGNFTGTLTLNEAGMPKLVALKGGLALEGVTGGAPDFVLDPDGDGMAVCPACGEEVMWTALADGERLVGLKESGHYYLLSDNVNSTNQFITTIAKEAVLCLHLNGKNLTTSGRIATVGSGGTINIMGKGTITGRGNYTGADQDAYTLATLVANSGGSINLYEDVTVTTTAAGKPVAAALNNGKINLYGNATVKEMTGGEGIDIQKGVLTVTAGWNGSALVKFPAALVDGVVPAANGVSTGEFTGILTLDAEGKPQLIAKDGGLAVKEGSGGEEEPANPYHKNLALDAEGKALCPVCNKTVQWTAVTDTHLGDQVTDGGHYYLANDFDSKSQFLTMTGGKKVCFHLNGKNLTYPSRMFVTGSTLNILGSGTVTSTSTNADNLGALVAAYGSGVINLYGGTYKTTNSNGMPVVTVYSSVTAKVNAYDGVTIESVEVHKGTFLLSGNVNVGMINVSANGVLHVEKDWTGTATVKFASELVDGVVPAANGVSTGGFTGTLTLDAEGKPQLTAKDGGLAVGTTDPVALEIQRAKAVIAAANAMDFSDANKLPTTCPACGAENVTWTAVATNTRIGDAAEGHYYLPADVNCPAAWTQYVTAKKDGTVCLHLNGKNLTYGGRIGLTYAGSTLNIMGTGTVTSTGECTNATYNTTALYVEAENSTLNLYGGTYTATRSGQYVLQTKTAKSAAVNIYEGAVLTDSSTAAAATATVADPTVIHNAGIINMYGGEIKNGTGTAGGNVRLSSGTTFNMYAGTISGGTGNYGGNVSMDVNTVFNMKGGTVTGGTSGNGGANFFLKGTLNIDGGTISGGISKSSSGGSIYAYGATITMTGGTVTGGQTVENGSHGGNISLTGSSVMTMSGGSVTGGSARYQAGNLHVSNSTFTMTGGEISGGTASTDEATVASNHNIWLYGTATMTMTGGTVKGVDGTVSAGTAIYMSSGTTLNLGGTASVIRDDGVFNGNIYTADGAKLNVLNDWTGTASVKLAKAYQNGEEVSNTNAQCGSLSGTAFTAGGTFSGVLMNENGSAARILGAEGKLTVETASADES